MIPPKLPPPRARQTSSDDVQDWRLDAVERAIDTLGSKMELLGATIATEAAKSRASGSSDNIKLICSTISAVVVAITGAYGVQKWQGPPDVPSTVVLRSEFDQKLDGCRVLPSGSPEQAACVDRVSAESFKP